MTDNRRSFYLPLIHTHFNNILGDVKAMHTRFLWKLDPSTFKVDNCAKKMMSSVLRELRVITPWKIFLKTWVSCVMKIMTTWIIRRYITLGDKFVKVKCTYVSKKNMAWKVINIRYTLCCKLSSSNEFLHQN